MIADTIRAVQRGLIAQGFSVGKSGADGQLGKQTRAALTAYQKANGLHPSGQADAATIAALLQPVTPPKPNLRPQPDVLGTGNTNVMPRPRPGPAGAPPEPPQPESAPAGGLMPFDAADNLDMTKVPGEERVVGNYIRPAVNATSLAQRVGSPTPQPPQQVGQMMNFPFASRWTEAPPPQSPGEQVAAQPIPSGPPPPPTQFQPSPDNQGYGLPGMPPNANPLGAMDDVRALIQQTIVDALLRGLNIQQQPNQPAYSDQFSTATPPPAFTTPSGPYR